MKYKYPILLAISLIALAGSLLLSFTPASLICTTGGCTAVHNSPYNFTFGLQNSYYGVAIFLILSTLIFLEIKKPSKVKKKLINVAIITGSIIAFYFIYLQKFVIGSWCQYCLVVDSSLILALFLIILFWEK